MENPYKIDARKSDAKIMPKGAKLEAKWDPKSSQNRKNELQNEVRKSMRKLMRTLAPASFAAGPD